MKPTSVRPVDELGRIVLPITVRRALDIKEKDQLDISLQARFFPAPQKRNAPSEAFLQPVDKPFGELSEGPKLL